MLRAFVYLMYFMLLFFISFIGMFAIFYFLFLAISFVTWSLPTVYPGWATVRLIALLAFAISFISMLSSDAKVTVKSDVEKIKLALKMRNKK